MVEGVVDLFASRDLSAAGELLQGRVRLYFLMEKKGSVGLAHASPLLENRRTRIFCTLVRVSEHDLAVLGRILRFFLGSFDPLALHLADCLPLPN
jgi:hypothetical protein